jgi:predicted RNA binding protein YcfA (HicA-like mRNA interferase family)
MSPHLPVATGREVAKALERAGFVVHHTTGGHAILRHLSDRARRITVPIHPGDLKTGTLRAIIKQSGLSIEAFTGLL